MKHMKHEHWSTKRLCSANGLINIAYVNKQCFIFCFALLENLHKHILF